MAQAPGQKGAFVPDSSERRRVDTKPLTTDAPLTAWGTWQGIGLSHRGDLGLAPPGWFGRGLLTRPSSAMAVSDRRRVTWRPTVGQTAGSGDPRRTKGRPAGLKTLAERNAEGRDLETLAERSKFATKTVGVRGRSRPTSQHATAPLLIGNKRHSDSRFKLNLQGRTVAWSNKKGEEAWLSLEDAVCATC